MEFNPLQSFGTLSSIYTVELIGDHFCFVWRLYQLLCQLFHQGCGFSVPVCPYRATGQMLREGDSSLFWVHKIRVGKWQRLYFHGGRSTLCFAWMEFNQLWSSFKHIHSGTNWWSHWPMYRCFVWRLYQLLCQLFRQGCGFSVPVCPYRATGQMLREGNLSLFWVHKIRVRKCVWYVMFDVANAKGLMNWFF